MKLTVEQTPRGRWLCVNGVPLPMQRKVTVVSEVGECPTVVVEFVHDGDVLRILGDAIEFGGPCRAEIKPKA